MHDRGLEAQSADLAWTVTLRWVAAAVIAAFGVAGAALGVVRASHPFLGAAGVLALANVIWLLRERRTGDRQPDPRVNVGHGFAKALLDLAVLAYLLHEAGGIENPFFAAFAVHMGMAGVVFPRAQAWGLVLFSGLLYTAMAVGEMTGLLEHRPLHIGGDDHTSAFNDPVHVVVHVGAVWMMNIGVVLFVRTIRRRQIAAETARRAHARVAQARERMARLGEVAGGVSHSVRNPLHGALNAVSIIESSACSEHEPTREMLPLMREALERIERVTSRLLALGREEGPHVVVDVRDVVREVANYCKTAAREAGVSVSLSLPQRAYRVRVDADQLVEALLNVVDNAIVATSDGGRVEIGVSPAGERVVVEVRDTGCGIEETQLPRVFDAFYTSKAIGEGTGLGLAIAKKVVENVGGDVSISSELGTGTTVALSLPLRSAASAGG